MHWSSCSAKSTFQFHVNINKLPSDDAITVLLLLKQCRSCSCNCGAQGKINSEMVVVLINKSHIVLLLERRGRADLSGGGIRVKKVLISSLFQILIVIPMT